MTSVSESTSNAAEGSTNPQYEIWGREAAWGDRHLIGAGFTLGEALAEKQTLTDLARDQFGSQRFGDPSFGVHKRSTQLHSTGIPKPGDLVLQVFNTPERQLPVWDAKIFSSTTRIHKCLSVDGDTLTIEAPDGRQDTVKAKGLKWFSGSDFLLDLVDADLQSRHQQFLNTGLISYPNGFFDSSKQAGFYLSSYLKPVNKTGISQDAVEKTLGKACIAA